MVHDRTAVPASPARTRVVRLQDTEAAILDAAREAVAAHGWQGAQMAAIASRAGVATGSLYRHFRSKADLFARVLALVSEREIAVVQAIAVGDGDAAARLHRAVTAFMQRALHRRRLAYALIAEPCEPEIDRARLVYRAALARVIEGLIRDGITKRTFRSVPAATAASCVTGAMMEALSGPLAPDVTPDTRGAATWVRQTADLCTAMVVRR